MNGFFSEKLLAVIPTGLKWSDIAFSESGNHVAFEAADRKKAFVILDGEKLREYDRVSDLSFLPNSDLVIYVGMDHYKHGYWQDEFDFKEYYHLVSDQEEGRAFQSIQYLTVSHNGENIAFAGEEKNGEKRLVLNGNLHRKYDKVLHPVFGKEENQCAYIAVSGKQSFVVNGEKEGNKYEEIRYLIFCPDGEIAYAAKRDQSWRIVVGEREWEQYDYVGCPAFSPDGNILAYKAKQGEDEFMFIGGNAGEAFDAVGTYPAFFPDGSKLVYEARYGNAALVVCGTEKGEPFDAVSDWIVFSADSKNFAYQAIEGDHKRIVINGNKSEYFSDTGRPLFSPDSKHIAYVARKGKKYFLILDDKEIGPFDWIDKPVFSPKSDEVGFGVRTGKELWWKVSKND